jgi:hypothetical protein
MAAGLGFIEFTTGDILTAASANGYLASQTVMVFASSAARAAAITSPQEGMFTYLKDTDITQYYNGSAYVTLGASSGGKVAQVLSTTKTDTFTTSLASGANAAITGLSQAITPTLNTSKILVRVSVTGNMANRNGFGASLARGATLIGIGDTAGSRTRVGAASAQAESAMTGNLILEFLDSPATTSATTYNVYAQNMNVDTRTVYVNRAETDTDSVAFLRAASTITVMEILA